MIAGLVLTDSTDRKSAVAFIEDDTTETMELETNPEIVEKLAKKKPEILAVNAGTDTGVGELTDKESELKEEGHSFTPTSHNKMVSRRLEALENQIFKAMGAEGPEIIRFDPKITSKELAIEGDKALESIGVSTEDINSAMQFDAVLGAVTARFYQQNQYKDLGVIVPESLKEE